MYIASPLWLQWRDMSITSSQIIGNSSVYLLVCPSLHKGKHHIRKSQDYVYGNETVNRGKK